jgi:tRNA threonylcarbamoyladenosine dehydratase
LDAHTRFSGVERLYGVAALERLRNAHVCVLGLGGVGSWTVEALARSAIGRLTLVDLDDVCVSNTNRQIHAVADNVGRPKAEAMRDRVLAINPSASVAAECEFFTSTTAESLMGPDYDVVVDCIDQYRNKCVLLEMCRMHDQPLVVVGGAGGRVDPSQVRLTDITKSRGDKLLQIVRKRLRQRHGFPRKGPWKVPCVWSEEAQRFPTPDGGICEVRPEDQSLRLDCATGFGAAAFVTGTFGLFAASAAVKLILSAPAR